MIGIPRVIHRMKDGMLGFNDKQSPFPKDERRVPWRSEL